MSKWRTATWFEPLPTLDSALAPATTQGMGIDRSSFAQLAHLCRLELDPSQLESMQADLTRLLEHFRQLQAVDTDGVELAPYPLPLALSGNPDEPEEPLSQANALANAPVQQGSSFLVPRVVDG